MLRAQHFGPLETSGSPASNACPPKRCSPSQLSVKQRIADLVLRRSSSSVLLAREVQLRSWSTSRLISEEFKSCRSLEGDARM
ncbi:hypothetical protein ILYODFUR_016897 [Ilyodon furcidens]|uniref:Uncharacterized protein n=1 Tax=Ilyodon furcidens TaxID=33524 RepID=A0ABV0TJK0_9TELE